MIPTFVRQFWAEVSISWQFWVGVTLGATATFTYHWIVALILGWRGWRLYNPKD